MVEILTKKQLNIFEPIAKNILKEFSIKEVKNLSKEKSNNAISIALKKFKKESLVRERKIGRSLLYSLNTKNDLVFNYMILINNEKLSNSVKESIQIIKEEIEKHTSFYSIVIFGSYAIGNQTKDSDLDIAIFIENEMKRKEIKTAMKSAELKSILKIDSQVITETEFLEMLKINEGNLGKQIARKHLSIHNPNVFYAILNKGIKNGFRF